VFFLFSRYNYSYDRKNRTHRNLIKRPQ